MGVGDLPVPRHPAGMLDYLPWTTPRDENGDPEQVGHRGHPLWFLIHFVCEYAVDPLWVTDCLKTQPAMCAANIYDTCMANTCGEYLRHICGNYVATICGKRIWQMTGRALLRRPTRTACAALSPASRCAPLATYLQ